MAKVKPVRFVSKMQNLTLCIRPNRSQIVDGIVVPVAGERVHFENGECILTDPKKIEFVRNHDLFGSQITEVKEEETGEGKTAE